jgi:uncharacterized protein YsxB (DUF464 family)
MVYAVGTNGELTQMLLYAGADGHAHGVELAQAILCAADAPIMLVVLRWLRW